MWELQKLWFYIYIYIYIDEKRVYFLRIKTISLVESKVHETEKAGIEYRINTPYHGRHAP